MVGEEAKELSDRGVDRNFDGKACRGGDVDQHELAVDWGGHAAGALVLDGGNVVEQSQRGWSTRHEGRATAEEEGRVAAMPFGDGVKNLTLA